MNRRQAEALVHGRGGIVSERVSRHTHVLVIGSDGWPLRRSGRLTRNLERAAKLQELGHAVEIIAESTFLKRLRLIGEEESIHRHYTLEQLSRVTGVSGLRLRHWVAAGLIKPVEHRAGVALFEFTQITATRTLWRLVSSGCRSRLLRDSLHRLGRWLPDASRTAESLERMHGMLVVRTADGELLDGNGQRLFRFEADDEASATLSWSCDSTCRSDPDTAFEEAVRWEQAGETLRAIGMYENWLDRFGNDADVLMNLGNLLMASDRVSEAAERYREATRMRSDDCRLWNNLGVALADTGNAQEAIAALHRAVECDRGFADAYYNLADILEDQGQSHRARLLWRRYLQHDATSEHARYAQQQVALEEGYPIS